MMHRALLVVLLAGAPLFAAQKPTVLPPTVFAIRDARVVLEAGKVLPRATVVLRDGVIEAVGAEVKVPADALVIEGKNLVVYPGFVDTMSNWGFDNALRRSEGGPAATEDLASGPLAATKADNRKGVTPEFVVATALKNDDQADNWRKIGISAHLIAPDGGYLVGQSALLSLSGATPREAVLRSPVAHHLSFRGVGGTDYPRALMGVVAHCRQTLLDAGYYRALRQYHEKIREKGKRPPFDPALDALGAVLDRKLPIVIEADTRDEIHRALDFAEEFHLQPIIYGGRDAWKAAERLKRTQVPVLLRLDFTPPDKEADNKNLPPRVKEDRQRKDREEQRCAALLQQQGVLFAFSTQGLPGDKPAEQFRANLRKAIAAGLKADEALRALTANAARILGIDKQLGSIAAGKAAHLVVMTGNFDEADSQVRYLFVDGIRFEYEVKAKPEKKTAPKKDDSPGKEPKKDEKKEPKNPEKPEQATEIEADRKPASHTGGNVLFKGATLLTVTHGTKAKTDLLVRAGKIAQMGVNLKAPEGVTVIDATGMFIMPGIIDTHSHFSISGGVNEFSLSVVPEVRVRDVINSEDVQIYRALGGGVTTARLLHGSANVIGGQDAVIKLKYGLPASGLLLAEAPRGVKFALGENVKRTDGRFPNTRLGVEAVLIRAFTEARAYQKAREDHQKAKAQGKEVPPFRRDLRLEALADVLQGDLKVHCHCYRADEILMLLRTADRFGVRIQSLQHVLEGYKIAPEIAAHGASCSSFSDWWAYKIEAFDAIPFNMVLLHEAGAQVCLKSDSHELMRHLYQEAAKCIKYGGMSETEALKTITLNGARQLGLDKRIGSLEVGKDADLAIFNGHPLNGYSRVEMTVVEGEVYFQRTKKLEPFAAAQAGPTTPARQFALPMERSSDGRYALVGATVHPVNGKPIPRATVVIEKGRILDVVSGSQVSTRAVGKVLDARGLHLYPGMIDGGTILGLTELGSARETQDYAEGGDFQPDLRASTGINPDSELIPVTRANGVTTVVTHPLGSLLAGQSALIDLSGWVPRDLIVVDPLALHIDFPAPRGGFLIDPSIPVGRAMARKQRDEKIRRLKELFQQARVYQAARTSSPEYPLQPRLEALLPYVRGERPVTIQAHRQADILEALKLAEELKVKMILMGGTDAWKVTEELKKHKVPVIVGPVMAMPSESTDPYDAPYACPARLCQAGVRFAIHSTGSTNSRNLPYEAAMAASYGLPPEEALKAVTLYPAQILGVDKEVGTIEKGKRANLVITNGDLLQPSTQVLGLFIDGRPLQPTSKQTRLYEKYQERLREVKEGRASLGTRP